MRLSLHKKSSSVMLEGNQIMHLTPPKESNSPKNNDKKYPRFKAYQDDDGRRRSSFSLFELKSKKFSKISRKVSFSIMKDDFNMSESEF